MAKSKDELSKQVISSGQRKSPSGQAVTPKPPKQSKQSKIQKQLAAPPAPHKAVFARLSYLCQAAAHLAVPQTFPSKDNNEAQTMSNPALARFYLSSMLTTSKKAVLRLDPTMKRTICKRCHSMLIPGVSSETRMENNSKNKRKRRADVLVVECQTCQMVKRFPVGEERVKKDRTGMDVGAVGEDGKMEECGETVLLVTEKMDVSID